MADNRWAWLFPLALAVTCPRGAEAYPYSAWGEGTGRSTFGFNPYLSVGEGRVEFTPYVLLGFTDAFDLILGATFAEGLDGPIEALPRVVISDAFVIAPHLTLGRDEGDLALEIHGQWMNDRLAFTHNTGARRRFGVDAGPGELFSILAPELALTPRVWLFQEVNPTVAFAETASASVELVPGVTVFVDREGYHLLTFAVPIGIDAAGAAAGVGMAYWGTFPLAKPVSDARAAPRSPPGLRSSRTGAAR